MMPKIKNYIKSLGFSWTDLFIVPFFTFVIIFVLEDVRLMELNDNLRLSQPLWAYITYSVISIISLGLFLFFEYKNGRKPKYIPLGIFLTVLLFNIIAIYLNSNEITVTVIDLGNYPSPVTTIINYEMMFIHLCSFIGFIISLYLFTMVIPQKFSNHLFLTSICYISYVLTIFVLIYSLINDSYIALFNAIFSGSDEIEHIKDYLPKCFFGNPNSFALYLELGLFLSFFHHSIKKDMMTFVFMFVYYVLLYFTMCKTAIMVATILLVSYLIYVLIKSIKKHDKKWLLASSTVLSIFVLILITIVILYFAGTRLRGLIEILFNNKENFTGRRPIWWVARQLIEQRPFYGYGHGIYNHVLYNTTTKIIHYTYSSSHNSFLTLLGEGGIVYLTAYIALLIYSLVLVVKMFKKNIELSLALLFGFIIFLVHSYFEDIYYYVELIIVFTMICYNISKYQSLKEDNKLVTKEA